MTVVLRAGAATDVGRLRTVNQDSFVLLGDRGLYVVADGMGGHQGGEVASRLAVDTIAETYHDQTAHALTEALAEANERIHARAADDPDLYGMGTTVVAAAIVREEPDPDLAPAASADEDAALHLLVANVGDSRAYLFRQGGLTQLTEDHSLVADLVREGRITPEEAESHPRRNIVTRVVGVYEQVEVDLWPVDPVEGDRIVLCSDGLFNEVGEGQIGAVLRRLEDAQEAAEELVRLANEGGGRDNITVVVLDVVDDGGVAEAASAALARDVRRSEPAAPPRADLAGFATALEADDSAAAGHGTQRRQRRRRERDRTATRVTWRTVLFVVAVVAVVGGAIATIQWYGTSTYYVGYDGDEVAIFRGRPGGLLWIEPELEQETGIDRSDVPSSFLDDLAAGHQQSSLAKAERYVSNIERDIIEASREDEDEPSATTSTTRAPTTTAVAPPGAP